MTAAQPVQPVLTLSDQPLEQRPPQYRPTGAAAERFDISRAMLGKTLGLKKLGCSLTQVAPGKTGYPFHSHRVNDEMFYIPGGPLYHMTRGSAAVDYWDGE